MNTWDESTSLDLYSDVMKVEIKQPTADSPEGIPVLNWETENFSWDNLDLEDVLNLRGVEPVPDTVEGIPEIDQCININANIPSPDQNDENGNIADSAQSHHGELMVKYGLTDDQLSDMTLKQLKRRCSLSGQDYNVLKNYRRTCLNRGYARSSRSKQQEKAVSLTAQLQAAQNKIKELQKEVEEKNLRIQYLELENRLLMNFSKDE